MKLRFSLLLLLVLATAPYHAAASHLPDPATKKDVPLVTVMQARVWQRLDFADFLLTGSVHGDKFKQTYPITLRTKGHQLVYEFNDQPLQIRAKLDPGVFTLQKRTSSKADWGAVSAGDFSKKILNTDMTYGDIALDFINWDDVEPLGTDSIKTLDAFVYEAKPGPNDHSPFASVRFWVSKKFWAFLRIDGINAKGQTVKRVEVQNVMQVGDTAYYVFKQMKIATMVPDKDDIAASTTFIDINDAKAGSGLKE